MAGKKRAKDACVFCLHCNDSVEKTGKKMTKDGLTVHYFCMLFACGLCQNGEDYQGFMGFLPKDIQREVKRGSRLKCVFCKKAGATVGCIKPNCRKVFHFCCGVDNGVLNQFFGTFKSYCGEHRPRQTGPTSDRFAFHGTAKSTCVICMLAVEARASDHTLRTPCCKNAWFHRECIENQARASGVHFFKCALCNNQTLFQKEMLNFGIFIPDQDAAWEREPNAYEDLLERHCRCDVENCLCPKGRTFHKDGGKWLMMLCDWCGSQGTHMSCSNLKTPLDDWVCAECMKSAGNMANNTEKKKKGKRKSTSPRGSSTMSSKASGLTLKRPKTSPQQKPPDKRVRLSLSGINLASPVSSSGSTNISGLDVAVGQRLPRLRFCKANTRSAARDTAETSLARQRRLRARPVSSTVSQASRPGSSTTDGKPQENDGHTSVDDDTAVMDLSQKPRWLQRLLSEDIITGQNCGQQFAAQALNIHTRNDILHGCLNDKPDCQNDMTSFIAGNGDCSPDPEIEFTTIKVSHETDCPKLYKIQAVTNGDNSEVSHCSSSRSFGVPEQCVTSLQPPIGIDLQTHPGTGRPVHISYDSYLADIGHLPVASSTVSQPPAKIKNASSALNRGTDKNARKTRSLSGNRFNLPQASSTMNPGTETESYQLRQKSSQTLKNHKLWIDTIDEERSLISTESSKLFTIDAHTASKNDVGSAIHVKESHDCSEIILINSNNCNEEYNNVVNKEIDLVDPVEILSKSHNDCTGDSFYIVSLTPQTVGDNPSTAENSNAIVKSPSSARCRLNTVNSVVQQQDSPDVAMISSSSVQNRVETKLGKDDEICATDNTNTTRPQLNQTKDNGLLSQTEPEFLIDIIRQEKRSSCVDTSNDSDSASKNVRYTVSLIEDAARVSESNGKQVGDNNRTSNIEITAPRSEVDVIPNNRMPDFEILVDNREPVSDIFVTRASDSELLVKRNTSYESDCSVSRVSSSKGLLSDKNINTSSSSDGYDGSDLNSSHNCSEMDLSNSTSSSDILKPSSTAVDEVDKIERGVTEFNSESTEISEQLAQSQSDPILSPTSGSIGRCPTPAENGIKEKELLPGNNPIAEEHPTSVIAIDDTDTTPALPVVEIKDDTAETRALSPITISDKRQIDSPIEIDSPISVINVDEIPAVDSGDSLMLLDDNGSGSARTKSRKLCKKVCPKCGKKTKSRSVSMTRIKKINSDDRSDSPIVLDAVNDVPCNDEIVIPSGSQLKELSNPKTPKPVTPSKRTEDQSYSINLEEPCPVILKEPDPINVDEPWPINVDEPCLINVDAKKASHRRTSSLHTESSSVVDLTRSDEDKSEVESWLPSKVRKRGKRRKQVYKVEVYPDVTSNSTEPPARFSEWPGRNVPFFSSAAPYRAAKACATVTPLRREPCKLNKITDYFYRPIAQGESEPGNISGFETIDSVHQNPPTTPKQRRHIHKTDHGSLSLKNRKNSQSMTDMAVTPLTPK